MKSIQKIVLAGCLAACVFAASACVENESQVAPSSNNPETGSVVSSFVPGRVYVVDTPSGDRGYPVTPTARELVEYCPQGIASITAIARDDYKSSPTGQLIVLCQE